MDAWSGHAVRHYPRPLVKQTTTLKVTLSNLYEIIMLVEASHGASTSGREDMYDVVLAKYKSSPSLYHRGFAMDYQAFLSDSMNISMSSFIGSLDKDHGIHMPSTSFLYL